MADEHAEPHPGDNPDVATVRSVLYGVLQHVGAELSAHQNFTAEQEHWGSIAQLTAEYETIAAVLLFRLARATARPAGSGRARKMPRLIPSADGPMTGDMRHALDERHELIEARADTVFATARDAGEP
ncbi:hypothetical protein [Micrococcoides hystricis]|uniref:hypothetical protein n=1 Tax=Micrococcoides hystricis TaxID=1572761 RepID=UPI00406BCA52